MNVIPLYPREVPSIAPAQRWRLRKDKLCILSLCPRMSLLEQSVRFDFSSVTIFVQRGPKEGQRQKAVKKNEKSMFSREELLKAKTM